MAESSQTLKPLRFLLQWPSHPPPWTAPGGARAGIFGIIFSIQESAAKLHYLLRPPAGSRLHSPYLLPPIASVSHRKNDFVAGESCMPAATDAKLFRRAPGSVPPSKAKYSFPPPSNSQRVRDFLKIKFVPDPASHPGDALQTLAPRRVNLVPSRLPSMSDLLLQVRLDYRREDIPTFRTGSGRALTLSESSIRKASSILESGITADQGPPPSLEGIGGDGFVPMFRTGPGKSVFVRQSSIRKAAAILEGGKGPLPISEGSGEDGCFPVFYTGSGNSVAVRQSSIRKAAAVLDEEGREAMVKARWNGVHGTAGVSGVDLFDIQSGTENSCASSGGFYSPSNHSFRSSNQNSLVSELHEADSAQPQIKFNTAGGRSISISIDAIQRAKNLLGGSELGVPFNDLEAQRPLLSFPKDKKIDDTSWNKENLSFGSQNARSKHGSRVPSHVGSLLKPKHLSSSCADMLRMIPEHKPVGGPLVEISHNIGAEYVDTYQLTGEKKRVARRSSVPPFKKPRISRFTAPLNNKHCCLCYWFFYAINSRKLLLQKMSIYSLYIYA